LTPAGNPGQGTGSINTNTNVQGSGHIN
jgi:hypothetical protein